MGMKSALRSGLSGSDYKEEPYWGPAVADPDSAFTSPMATIQPVARTGATGADMSGSQGAAYYDADGSLMVWTGAGYHKVPTLAAGDVTATQRFTPYAAQGDAGLPDGLVVDPNWQYTPDGSPSYGTMSEYWGIADPTKYGLPDHFNNFTGGGTSQDELNYLLKSGDKEGTKIKYVRQEDGSYKPVYEGVEFWDTNDSRQNMALLSIAMAPVLAYAGQALTGVQGVNSMTGAGGTALAGSADAALYGGMAGAGAGGAAAGGGLLSSGAMNPYDAALMAGGEPIAGSGFSGASSGTTAFGQPFTAGATLSGAGEAAGSLFGLPNMGGVPGAVAGGAFSGSPTDLYSPTLGGSPGGAADFLSSSATTPTGGTPSTTGMPDWMKNLSPNLVKGLLTLAGGIAGKPSDSGSGSGTQAAIPPTTIPKLYGEGGTSGPGLMNSWGAMGPTETERRMRQQYLPGLLGGANPWGY